jgi:3-phenylpropionate/cinnamic acid dioxygenase small subunit
MTCLACEIGAVNTRFGRALDRKQVDEWVELFTPDATYDNGRVVLRGHDQLRTWITRRAAVRERTTRHVWSGLQLDLVSDVEVRAESIWVCYAANQEPPVDIVTVWSVADFVDTFHRVDGRWLIGERTIRTIFRDPAMAPKV